MLSGRVHGVGRGRLRADAAGPARKNVAATFTQTLQRLPGDPVRDKIAVAKGYEIWGAAVKDTLAEWLK